MENLLAEVAAELVPCAKSDYLTLRATCDNGYTSQRVTSGPSDDHVHVRHLKSLVALGGDGNVAEPIPCTAPRDAVRLVGHHPLWVPIVRYPSGEALCVDLAPGPRGRVGQVIQSSLGCHPLELLADSVTEWHRSPERPESSGMKGHYDVTDY